MRTLPLLLLLALPACEPTAKDDTGDDTAADDTDTGSDDTDTGDDTDTDTADTGDTDTAPATWDAVLVTVSSDYASGAVALVDQDLALTDGVFPATGDTIVVVQDGTTYLLHRSSEDTVQAFAGTDFSAPTVEFSTGEGSVPRDVASCDGKLFVSLYREDHLGVYDPTSGLPVGTVDLTAYSDDDGSPEADGLAIGPDGFLYVALNQLDYTTYRSADGSGSLVKVDCATLEAVDAWDAGPGTSLAPHPSDPNTLLLFGGNYFTEDWSGPDLDGGLWTFDVATGEVSGPHLTEEALGGNVGGFAGDGDTLLMTLDDGATWSLHCVDTTDWTVTLADAPNAYIGGMATAPDGDVWVMQRENYAGTGEAEIGTVIYDLDGCAPGATVETAFPPYDVAFSPGQE